MIVVWKDELRMAEERFSDGLFLGWRVVQTVHLASGQEAECEWGHGLDEETARTILQRING